MTLTLALLAAAAHAQSPTPPGFFLDTQLRGFVPEVFAGIEATYSR